jgi:hypothetical protein
MINSYEELVSTLEGLDLGTNSVRIAITTTAIQLDFPVCPAKVSLPQTGNWLDSNIAAMLKRKFDSETRKWVPKPDVLPNIKKAILLDLIAAITFASNAKMPERTTLYKEYKDLNDRYGNDSAYLSSVIQILNYYNGAKTDPTCKSNVIGLLNILRKRYNGKSSSAASGADTSIPF